MQKDKKKNSQTEISEIILIIVIIVALVAFISAGIMLIGVIREYKDGEDAYDTMKQYTQSVPAETADSSEAPDTASAVDEQQDAEPTTLKAPIQVDFASLQNVNEDIVGWVYVEAMPDISYPIVRGTDNEYYLKRTAEKKKNKAASIFMDYRNNADFTDAMTVLYGHNMKNGTMFGNLKDFQEKEAYKTSPYIWILTPDRTYRYEIFSVRDVDEQDSLYALDLVPGDMQKSYMEDAQEKSDIETTASFTGTEKLLTLSTCTKNDRVRLVVQAVEKGE